MNEFDIPDWTRLKWILTAVGVIIAIILIATIYQVLLAFPIENIQFLPSFLQGLGGLGTLILAYLYLKQHSVMEEQSDTQQQQTDIMDGQRYLRRRELNRDIREKHTEVLRHRVEQWLGETPATGVEIDETITQNPRNPHPVVTGTTIKSAAGGTWVLGEDDEFRAAPQWLEDDQYLRDLLENHAPELRDLKDRIEELERIYSAHHDRFVERVGEVPRRKTSEYIIEPAYNFPEWLFQQIVLMERGRESREELHDRASNIVEAAGMADGDASLFPGEDGYGYPVGVFRAKPREGDRQVIADNRKEVEEEIVALLRSVIDDIDEIEPYDSACRSAETLEELDQVVSQLRVTLTKYEGLPLYPNDCKYLEDELIEEDDEQS
jgi:hypothetical protein